MLGVRCMRERRARAILGKVRTQAGNKPCREAWRCQAVPDTPPSVVRYRTSNRNNFVMQTAPASTAITEGDQVPTTGRSGAWGSGEATPTSENGLNAAFWAVSLSPPAAMTSWPGKGLATTAGSAALISRGAAGSADGAVGMSKNRPAGATHQLSSVSNRCRSLGPWGPVRRRWRE